MTLDGRLDAEDDDCGNVNQIKEHRRAPLYVGPEEVPHLLVVEPFGDEADPGEVEDTEGDDRGGVGFEECRHSVGKFAGNLALGNMEPSASVDGMHSPVTPPVPRCKLQTMSIRDSAVSPPTPLTIEGAGALARRLDDEIGKVVIGQAQIRREIMTCLFAGGHCLLRGVPGLAKTLLIKTLADAVHLKFSRIQFTPDLMPSDILGTEVIEDDAIAGKRHVRFIPGPVFANIILADEINRTPPRTQAALLEAMQEFQVTVGGVRHALDRPLFVLATENPIEQEGTYPLPEAQLDRFMFNVVMDYPAADDERRILAETTRGPGAVVQPVATGQELEQAQALVRSLPAAENVVDYALRLIRATRPAESTAPSFIRDWIRWGAGPRAGQALLLGAKAAALLDGRPVPSLDDVTRVAHPVLRHRILVNFRAEADGVSSDDVIDKLLGAVRP